MGRARPAGPRLPCQSPPWSDLRRWQSLGQGRYMHPSRPQVPAGSAGARNVCSEGLMPAMPLQGEGAPEARSEERAEGLCGAQTGCLPEAFLPSALDPDFRASLLLTLPCCPSRVFRSRHWSPHRPPPLCPGGLATAACPSPEREGRSLGLWVTPPHIHPSPVQLLPREQNAQGPHRTRARPELLSGPEVPGPWQWQPRVSARLCGGCVYTCP